MSAVIEVEGLTKVYRRLRGAPVTAIDGLDLSVPEGGVFGFLGPNGSGKTTTIRCLLGLVAPTAGVSSMLGAPIPSRLGEVIGRVGSIVESPNFFPAFSGRRNLELLGRLAGEGPSRIGAILDQVGLAERADDLVRRYSLGMRQRLGVAAALLKDPALLVLDEPANGLDPAGIREIRDLLRRLGREGRTVFLSSHILSEVQQTCDRVAILSRGRCVTSGLVDDVLQTGRVQRVLVRVDDLEHAREILAAGGFTVERRGAELVVDVPAEGPIAVSRYLGRRRLWVTELRPEEVSLEDVFLELTEERPA